MLIVTGFIFSVFITGSRRLFLFSLPRRTVGEDVKLAGQK